MPLQNRVTPLGELVSTPDRGLVYGNRGCLHDDRGRIRRRFAGRRWIACRLEFRGWHREPLMQPGRFTELFFLDEATAFAAGHRPCALCRREDYRAFVTAWRDRHPGMIGADAFDELPDGAFVLHEGEPFLVHGPVLRPWTTSGYVASTPRPTGRAVLITPPSLVAVLRAGWSPLVPFLHPSALVRPRPTRGRGPARRSGRTTP
jgi:hypothetical protein